MTSEPYFLASSGWAWNPPGTRKSFLRFFLLGPGSVFVPWGKFRDLPHMTVSQPAQGSAPFLALRWHLQCLHYPR